jgi:hypothetical protein
MKKILFFNLSFISSFILFGQYDFVVKSLFPNIDALPDKIEFTLIKSTEVQNEQSVDFFELSNSFTDVCYYPKQNEVDCGYFVVGNKEFKVGGNYPHPSWGCDLDENSFELSEFSLQNKKFIALTAINWGSGSSTRIVFCHLFDVTNREEVLHFSLWSMYGSSRCFGDYNADGKIDFLQIRYDQESKDNNFFRMTFSTIEGDQFEEKEDKFIVFKREYQDDDLPKIISVSNKWN